MEPLTIIRAIAQPDREACIGIRLEVFVTEQLVPLEIEIDEYEETAWHFLARRQGAPVATARALLADRQTAKIGRVAVCRQARGQGVGAAVMRAVEADPALQAADRLILDSQVHAIAFYQRLGYASAGPIFMDAGIPHQHMEKLR